MKNASYPRPHTEANPNTPTFIKRLKKTADNLWNDAKRFVERNSKYAPVLAAGALATAYGVVKGYNSVDMMGNHLETLGANFISTRSSTAPETSFDTAATGIMFSTGSVLTGIGAFVGVAAHKVKHIGEPENALTAGLFVEEQRELVPEHQGGGLYVIQGGAPENQPTPRPHVGLSTLLNRAA